MRYYQIGDYISVISCNSDIDILMFSIKKEESYYYLYRI
jgi:hypothetical protein